MTPLLVVALAWGPGALLAFTVTRGRLRWAAVAAAPALTLGLVTVAAGWLRLLGTSTDVMTVLRGEIALVAAATAASAAIGWYRAPLTGPRWWQVAWMPWANGSDLSGRLRSARADVAAVCALAATTLTWGWRLGQGLSVPSGFDAMNHAFLARRLLDTASSDPAAACVTGSTVPEQGCAFYPIAAHVVWGQATSIGGAPLSEVMLAWLFVVGPLAVTTGVYATLRLLGAGVVVSAVCASVPLVLGPLWRPLVSGLITAQTGLALTPAIAVLVALALRRERSRRLAVLGGLGVAGVILTHTYDILAVALLTLLMAATMRVLRARLRTLVHGVALLGGTAAAALWPWLDGISRAAGERGQVPPAFPGDPLAAAAWWFLEPASYLPFSIELQAPAPGVITWVEPTSPAGVFVTVARALVLVSPLAFFVRELRWARPWIGLLAVAGAVGTVTMSTSGPARDAVAGLWYGDAARVLFMVAPAYGVAACAGGCVVATLVRRAAGPAVPPALRRSRPVRWMQARGVTSATAAIGIGSVTTASLLMSLASAPSAWRPADTVFRQFAPLDPGMRRTYGWLADRLQPGEVVADDVHRELVTWGYADAGIGLLFGLVPIDPAAQRDWDARRMAWYWLVGVARTDHGCLVRHYRIRYVVVSERPIPAGRSRYVSSLLETPRNVELVHVDGPARVYEVTERGRRCPDETTRQADRSGARTTQTVSRGIVVSSLRSTS